jgi:hypothetical protein
VSYIVSSVIFLCEVCVDSMPDTFSVGSYDKCVHLLRETNKDNMAAVTETIFSHAQVTSKNILVIALIVSNYHIYAILLSHGKVLAVLFINLPVCLLVNSVS